MTRLFELHKLVDHCEMDHEFEIAPIPGTTSEQLREVKDLHERRHEPGMDHWNHTHDAKGNVVYKEDK